MNLFSKIFGTLESREANRLLRDVETRVKATYALAKVGLAVVQAADSTHKELAPALGISLQEKPSEQRILLFYELLYFFSHMTLRAAVASRLTAPQIGKLQGYIGPVLASTAVDAFFRHWPDNLKEKMKSEFFEKLNDAEMEYTECNAIWLEDAPLSPTVVFGKLANNVAALWDRDGDSRIMTVVLNAAVNAFGTMQLDSLMQDVTSVIDDVKNP